MAPPNSRKPASGTKRKTGGTFQDLLRPGLVQVFHMFKPAKNMVAPTSYKIYPGAVFDVDDTLGAYTDVSDSFCKTERVLPPGIPLDDDIFNSILFHLTWWRDINKFFSSGKGVAKDVDDVQEIVTNKLEIMYMEALWRKINKKK